MEKTDAFVSIYEMDEKSHEWREKKGECHLMLDKKMEKQWIGFEIKDVLLENNKE